MKVSNKVFLSLGSNIGDRESNIAQAISAIEINRGIENINSASFYHTEPLYNKDQGFFINTVIQPNFFDISKFTTVSSKNIVFSFCFIPV